MEIFVREVNPTKINISASQRISNMNCMNYDHNKSLGLFKFKKLKGLYSQKIITAQIKYLWVINWNKIEI